MNKILLDLKVNNHPGVLSRICGLFARRGFRYEALYCSTMQDNQFSRVCLIVDNGEKFEQIIRQTEKLQDVLAMRSCEYTQQLSFAELQTEALL